MMTRRLASGFTMKFTKLHAKLLAKPARKAARQNLASSLENEISSDPMKQDREDFECNHDEVHKPAREAARKKLASSLKNEISSEPMIETDTQNTEHKLVSCNADQDDEINLENPSPTEISKYNEGFKTWKSSSKIT